MASVGRRARSTVPPICAASWSSQSGCSSAAMTAGCAARRYARRSRARRGGAGRAPRTRRGRRRARTALAWRRGRTIWRKPKPLTAVRSNGCGQDRIDRLGDRLPRRLAADGRQVDADRAADAVAADRPRGGRARRRARARSGGRWPSTSIRVIAGVSDTRSSPPGKATIPLRASSSRSDQPAASSASLGEGQAKVTANESRAPARRRRR